MYDEKYARYVEQRTIFRQVTIFRHLFLISCNFFIFERNRFLSFMPMKSKNVYSQTIQRNGKKLLKHSENHYSKMWRNMVPPAKYGSLL